MVFLHLKRDLHVTGSGATHAGANMPQECHNACAGEHVSSVARTDGIAAGAIDSPHRTLKI